MKTDLKKKLCHASNFLLLVFPFQPRNIPKAKFLTLCTAHLVLVRVICFKLIAKQTSPASHRKLRLIFLNFNIFSVFATTSVVSSSTSAKETEHQFCLIKGFAKFHINLLFATVNEFCKQTS